MRLIDITGVPCPRRLRSRPGGCLPTRSDPLDSVSSTLRVPCMHYLIVKTGALGDVVRTSYFAKALKHKHGPDLRLSWFTAPASVNLLRLDPSIDDLWLEFGEAR